MKAGVTGVDAVVVVVDGAVVVDVVVVVVVAAATPKVISRLWATPPSKPK